MPPQRKAQVEVVVYWVNVAGELMLAPDTNMPPFRGWRRVECHTVAEIEAFSRRMAQQEFSKFRSLKVEEHLRHRERRERIRNNCLLRLAQGCISAADEAATRRTLASINAKDELLYKLLASEPDLTRGSLVIEQREQPIGRAAYSGKKRGLQPNDLNLISQLSGSTT